MATVSAVNVSSAFAAEWWIDAQNGVDVSPTYNGTPGAPRKTVPLSANIAHGDGLLLRGVFEPPSWTVTTSGVVITLDGKNNVTIDKWPGEEAPSLYGGKVLTGWTVSSGNRYTATIPATTTGLLPFAAATTSYAPAGLSVDYHATTIDGHHAGFFYRKNASIGTGALDPGYFIDTSGSPYVVELNLGGADPDDHEVRVGVCHELHIVWANNCDNLVIRNLRLRHAPAAQDGYGIDLVGCDSPTVESIDGQDLGTHCVVFYGCTGTLVARDIGGAGGLCALDSHWVTVFSDSGNAETLRLTLGPLAAQWQPRRPLKYGAAAASRANYTGGVTEAASNYSYHHTDGAGGRVVDDIVISGGSLVYDSDFLAFGVPNGLLVDYANIAGGNSAVDAGDYWDASAYPVRVRGVRLIGLPSYRPGASSHFTAYDRCLFVANAALYTYTEGMWTFPVDTTDTQVHLFDSCVFVLDGDDTAAPAGGWMSFFISRFTKPNLRCYFLNCVLVNTGTNAKTNVQQIFELSHDQPNYHARGCVFGFSTADALNGLFRGTDAFTDANVDFLDNRYWNINAARWSLDADRDTSAEWFASIDTSGATLASDPFVDIAAGHAGIVAGNALRTPGGKSARVSPLPVRGFNGLPYDGTYGAFQYGLPAGLDGAGLMRLFTRGVIR